MSATNQPYSRIDRLIIITVFFTGLSGLIYEVTWQRYLANLLGSEAKSTAVVLSVFLGGLALGYQLFGRISKGKSPRDLVKLCGIAEIAIGVWAFFFPNIYELIWNTVGVISAESSFSLIFEIFLAAVLLLVPTILMGSTLPLLTQGIGLSREGVPQVHARIYASNTGGAFLGCVVAGFILLPYFGLPISMMMTSVLNIIGGIVLATVAAHLSSESQPKAEATKAATRKQGHLILIVLSFAAGFLGLTFQTLLVRIAGLSLGSSDYTFSMIVALYILMLAVGASRVASAKKSGEAPDAGALFKNQIFLLCGLTLFYAVVSFLPYTVLLVRTIFSSVLPAFYVYYFSVAALFALLLALPLMAMGKAMPLLVTYSRPELADSGDDVGRLYFWNAAGCVLGALVGGYLLLFWFNFDILLKACIGAAAAALLLMIYLAPTKYSRALKVVSGFFILLAFLMPHWSNQYLGIGLFRQHTPFTKLYDGAAEANRLISGDMKILARRDDPNGSISVGETPTKSANGNAVTRSIIVNGKSDGSTSAADIRTTRFLADLPMLLSTSANSKVAVIGFGTGATSGELTLYPEIQSVDCIEISPSVREFSSFFSFINYDVTASPKFHWHNTDAFRFLASATDKYRLILSEPSNPWVGGVERLYSEEFLERAKQSLDKGGIYAQWFHTYAVSSATLGMVMNTFSSVFAHTRIFDMRGDVIVLGSDAELGAAELRHLQEQWATNAAVKKSLAEVELTSPAQILSMELDLSLAAFANSAVHTLDFPKLSFAAGKDFFLDLNSSPEGIADQPEQKLWAGVAKSRSLLKQWVETVETNRKSAVYEVAQLQCGTRDPQLIAGWGKTAIRCRTALANLAALGSIKEDDSLTPEIVGDMREFMALSRGSRVSSATADKKIQEAKTAIVTFENFNGSLWPFSVSVLMQKAKACLDSNSTKDSLKCRVLLIEALMNSGSLNEAKTQFGLLTGDKNQSEVPDFVKNDLGRKLAQAQGQTMPK